MPRAPKQERVDLVSSLTSTVTKENAVTVTSTSSSDYQAPSNDPIDVAPVAEYKPDTVVVSPVESSISPSTEPEKAAVEEYAMYKDEATSNIMIASEADPVPAPKEPEPMPEPMPEPGPMPEEKAEEKTEEKVEEKIEEKAEEKVEEEPEPEREPEPEAMPEEKVKEEPEPEPKPEAMPEEKVEEKVEEEPEAAPKEEEKAWDEAGAYDPNINMDNYDLKPTVVVGLGR